MVLIVGWLRNEAMALEGKAAIENTKRFLQVIFDGYIIIIIVFLPFFLIRRKATMRRSEVEDSRNKLHTQFRIK